MSYFQGRAGPGCMFYRVWQLGCVVGGGSTVASSQKLARVILLVPPIVTTPQPASSSQIQKPISNSTFKLT